MIITRYEGHNGVMVLRLTVTILALLRLTVTRNILRLLFLNNYLLKFVNFGTQGQLFWPFYGNRLTSLRPSFFNKQRSLDTKGVCGEKLDVVECLSPILEYSSRFLSALQQNTSQSRLFLCFIVKNPFYSPRNTFYFQRNFIS